MKELHALKITYTVEHVLYCEAKDVQRTILNNATELLSLAELTEFEASERPIEFFDLDCLPITKDGDITHTIGEIICLGKLGVAA